MIRHTLTGDLYLRQNTPDNDAGTVLYVHGLGESGFCFEGLLGDPRLARWHQVAVDMPGYGKSPWADEPLTLPEQADGLARWIKDSLDETPVVVGHSMGGVIGTLLAERHPECLKAFVNVEGNISADDCQFSGRVAGQSLDEFLAEGKEKLYEAIFLGGVETPAWRIYYPSVRFCDPRAFHKNGVELVAISEREDLAQRMAALPVPGLFLAGVPDGLARRSLELLAEAGVDVFEVNDAGHWPFLDQPDVFVERLAAFLDS